MIHKHQHFDLLGKIVLQRVIFTPPLKLHEKLDSEACLLYSIKGNSTLYDPFEKYSIKPETGILMKCGNYFNHWHLNRDNSNNEAVAIHLYPDLIKHVYKNKLPDFLISEKQPQPLALAVLDQKKLLKPYIESLIPYFNNPRIVDEEVIILKIRELLSLLYKINSHNIRDLLHDLFNPNSYDFKQIVEKNLYQDISIDELAHLCNMSLSSFKRKFKALYNNSPATYLKNKRLEKAAQLLTISNERIIDICYDCGFSSVDNFSKTFRQKYGKPPSEYRKQITEPK